MATLSPSVTIHDPLTGRGGRGDRPPISDGGNGNGGNGSSPDFIRRLRRARVGFFILAVWVSMLFISFTSAYVVRKDLPSLNQNTNQLGKDWIPVDLPVSLLVVNTVLLIGSSVTIEFARRKVAQRMALAPVGAIPGIAIGRAPQGSIGESERRGRADVSAGTWTSLRRARAPSCFVFRRRR